MTAQNQFDLDRMKKHTLLNGGHVTENGEVIKFFDADGEMICYHDGELRLPCGQPIVEAIDDIKAFIPSLIEFVQKLTDLFDFDQ